MDELQSQFEALEKEIVDLDLNQETLTRNYNELIELRHVLAKDSAFFSESEMVRDEPIVISESTSLLDEQRTELNSVFSKAIKLGFVTGVILRSKFNSFERVLWRATRGNLFMKHADIEEEIYDPQTDMLTEKTVFIVFFQGDRAQIKIKKICESFGANLYPCQDDPAERREFLSQVRTRLQELDKVLESSRQHRRSVLLKTSHRIDVWSEKLLKEKSIYHTMNLFNHDPGRKCLIAEGWCPKTATEKIVDAMRRATESSGALVPSILSVVQHNDEPPTYFRTNRFTSAFQAIVDAYGVAHYREVNPAVFTLITFPFLFAVMFGDFGHGLLMTIFAAYLCIKEKSLAQVKLNEMVATCFSGRYLILLMGIFSMYTGLIYNECFSVALDLCGTNWKFQEHLPVNATVNIAQPINPNRAYEFGVDPSWNGATNTLNYYNSLKMKLSIIFGVTHMCLGIFMSFLNALHFGHTVDIFFEFLPQIIFMMSLFGYMVFLIFYKWSVVSWPGNPPFLLNVMIQMFLSPLSLKEENTVFPHQHPVQGVLLILAIAAVPWMLFPKPLILRSQHKRKLQQRRMLDLQDGQDGEGGDHHAGPDFDFGEIFVKQSIHTIEFVLGAISNTASYLRLWALSLAHSELSVVFWDRVFIFLYHMGEKNGVSNMAIQWILVFVAWSAWAGATFAVLLLMESLSAFLHALRLHWVEFQNKFYHGDGTPFTPFCYEALRAQESGTEEPPAA
eukprot:TRINITY_DN29_c0_g1_i1.p1 TRINITY_DN29_c0_g1~~TRINITY_DN29_c0_g1_i1.p1  ORF type:complete len:860 (+),score=223.58 TRINITY_DN29_c0_g1_i1:386-2581(+)